MLDPVGLSNEIPLAEIATLGGTLSSIHLHIAILMFLIGSLNPKNVITPISHH